MQEVYSPCVLSSVTKMLQCQKIDSVKGKSKMSETIYWDKKFSYSQQMKRVRERKRKKKALKYKGVKSRNQYVIPNNTAFFNYDEVFG